MVESIYNFIPKPRPEVAAQSRYRSKYGHEPPLVASTFGLNGTRNTGKGVSSIRQTQVVNSTFGPREVDVPDPSKFLRRGSRARMPSVPATRLKCRSPQKPPVPTRTDRPVMGLVTCRNFVTSNAAETILASPPKRKKEEDDEDGEFFKGSSYGNVPEYLERVKGEIRSEQEVIDRHVREKIEENKEAEPECVPMEEEERLRLLGALKGRWDKINHNYQKISHRVAIEYGDIKRKEAQEAELGQLEKDMEQLSRVPVMIEVSEA